MATVKTVQKCRKAQKCSKCGKLIEVGQPYKYAEPYGRSKIIRCVECGLKDYETSGSEFVKTVGALLDNWDEDYGPDHDAIQSELENLYDTCEENFDNIPEQLQEGSAGELLQERMEMLQDIISELEQIDDDSIRSDVEEEFLAEFLSDNDLDEDLDEVPEEYKETYENELEDKVNEAIKEAIEEALQNLEY